MSVQRFKPLLTAFLFLLIAMAALLSSCAVGIAYGPSVVVGSLILPPGGSGYVTIRIFGLGNLQSLQVGPQGRFTFDPTVVQVKGIEGLNGFRVFAGQVDNANGKALFLAGYPGGSGGEDGVVRIAVKAVGRPGSSSILTITGIDLLADSRGNEILDYEIINGRVSITSPGIGP